MNSPRYANLANFVWFQAIWFMAIFIGSHNIGLALISALILLHFFLVEEWKKELRIILACSTIGVAMDSFLTVINVFEFTQNESLLPIPIWLVTIWIGFTGTLNHSLAYLVKKPYLMTFLAAISAPLSYMAAARFDAVLFPLGYTYTFLIVAASWIIMIPCFVLAKQRLD